MAKIIRNPKNFLMVAMNRLEAYSIGIPYEEQCPNCRIKIEDTLCFIAAINRCVCPSCMKQYVYSNKHNLNQEEIVNYNVIASKLNLPYADNAGNIFTSKR